MLDNILIATNNKHKAEKLTWIVNDYFYKIDYPQDLIKKIEIDEDGEDFVENASKKAIEYSKIYDGYTIATDGGIIIPALGKNWNPLRTKRFAGEDTSDFERIRLLLELMKDKKGHERKIVWKEAIALAKNGQVIFTDLAEGMDALLDTEFNKNNYKEGIWVCSISYFPQFKKNFFELTEEQLAEAEISWEILKNKTTKFLESIKK